MSRHLNVLTSLLMLEAGLAPININDGNDPLDVIKKMMNTLSEKDRRIAARKFRKQWRKVYKRGGVDFEQGEPPSGVEMRRRIWMVWQMFAEEQIIVDD
jgi:DNA/RNA-binding domain of Phe-tRNA-synthetase-like protein